MALATLSIDLVAKLASFEQGMTQAQRIAEKNAAAIERAFAGVKKAVAGLGIAAIVTDQLNGVRAAIDKLDAFDDLSEKYGIAANKLGEYSYASEVAGTNTEAFVSGLSKLAKNMSAAAGGSKEQVAAFKAIGVEVKNTNGTLRSADEVLLDVAEKFSTYEDSAGKAALAQKIFGKSGADMIPLLNKGRQGIQDLNKEAEAFGVAFGDDAAKAAGDFNDNVKRIELAGQAAALGLAATILPTLVAITNQLIEGRKAYGSFASALFDIGLEVDPFKSTSENIAATVKDLITQRGELAEMVARAQRIADGTATLGDKFNDVGGDRQRKKYADQVALLEKRLTYLQRIAALDIPDLPSFGGGGKKAAPVIADGSQADAAEKSYRKLIESIRERGALAQAELDNNAKLDEADKFRVEMIAKLESAENHYSAAVKAAGKVEVERAAKQIEAALTREKIRKAADEAAAEEQAAIKSIEEAVAARVEENRVLDDQIRYFGMTADAIERLKVKRMEDALTVERWAQANAEAMGAGGAVLNGLNDQANALQRQIALRTQLADKQAAEDNDPLTGAKRAITDYLDGVEKAGKASRDAVTSVLGTLENDLTTSLSSGKISVRSTVNAMIAEFERLYIVKPLLAGIFGDGAAGGSGGLVGSAFTAIKGFLGFERGGAFDIAGARPFAAGGVFDSPQLFKFANGAGLSTGVLGEAGPEAIMPLRRGPNGKLGVVASGGGQSATQVTNNFHVGAGVSRGEVVSLLQGYGQQLKGEILLSMRNKGAFSH